MAQRQGNPVKALWLELQTIVTRAREVWRLVPARHRWALAGGVLVMGLGSAASTAIPLLLGTLVNAVNTEVGRQATRTAVTQTAFYYLMLVGIAYLLREALNVLRRFLVENACTRIDRDMCVRLVSHLLRVDVASFSHEQVGALHGRITRSVDGFVRFLRISFLDFIPALMTGGFALVAALSKQPRIALAMAGVAPLSVLLTSWQLMTQKGVRLSLLRSREAMDGTVVEQLTGLDYIRAANTYRQEVERVERTAERRRSKEIRHHFEMSLFGCGKALNEGLFHLLVIAFAIVLFVNGQIQNGDILTFSVLFLNVMAPLNEIHRFVDEAHESSLRVGDLIEILAEPVDRSFQAAPTREPALVIGEPVIVAEGLEVDYRPVNGRPRRALKGVSMAIRHGETIGVVGRSGGGKSTWLRTLLRLSHPSGGKTYLGGIPLELVSREAIGELIGYVGQNPFVVSGTIAENIAYGQSKATRSEIENAARLACLHDEIVAMHGGYDALVSERGQNLSGGQRQRIALARVFLKNPPILILDEGTSALDNINERLVQQAITAARVDRTVILVAHRLTTLRDADRILVFNDGQIVESGHYHELASRGGVFTDLVRSATEGLPPNVNLELLFAESRKSA